MERVNVEKSREDTVSEGYKNLVFRDKREEKREQGIAPSLPHARPKRLGKSPLRDGQSVSSPPPMPAPRGLGNPLYEVGKASHRPSPMPAPRGSLQLQERHRLFPLCHGLLQ